MTRFNVPSAEAERIDSECGAMFKDVADRNDKGKDKPTPLSPTKSAARIIAEEYYASGRTPIRIPLSEKAPRGDSWQKCRANMSYIANTFNGDPCNIGVLLGQASSGEVDVDLDCLEAVAIAPDVLPPTNAIFGRKSKRASHWLYRVTGEHRTKKFTTPDGSALVELRGDGGQTVYPGSTHPSGESVEWERNETPQQVDYGELLKCVEQLASLSLIAKHWPSEGSRHDAVNALAGGLYRAGIRPESIPKLVRRVAEVGGDADTNGNAHEQSARLTVEKAKTGEKVTGWPKLTELIGAETVKRARGWLGTKAPTPKAPHSEFQPRIIDVCAASIEPKTIDWLWHNRFPIAMFSLISGEGKVGKGMITVDMAARLSNGTPFTDAMDVTRAPMNVAFLAEEDPLEYTTVPRLIAASANLTRIHFPRGVQRTDEERSDGIKLLIDAEALTAYIRQLEIGLLIIDPIGNYLPSKTDSHNDASVRDVLMSVSRIAEATNCAIIAVAHHNKGSGNAADKIMGSAAFRNVPRACWMIKKDAENPRRRLMLNNGSNLPTEDDGLAFSFVNGQVRWEAEPVRMSAQDAIDAETKTKRRSKESQSSQVAEWLGELLADGPMDQRDVQSAADAAKITRKVLWDAKTKAKVISKKDGMDGGWRWSLPEDSLKNPDSKVRESSSNGGNLLRFPNDEGGFEDSPRQLKNTKNPQGEIEGIFDGGEHDPNGEFPFGFNTGTTK